MSFENQCSKFNLEFRFHSFDPLGECRWLLIAELPWWAAKRVPQGYHFTQVALFLTSIIMYPLYRWILKYSTSKGNVLPKGNQYPDRYYFGTIFLSTGNHVFILCSITNHFKAFIGIKAMIWVALSCVKVQWYVWRQSYFYVKYPFTIAKRNE